MSKNMIARTMRRGSDYNGWRFTSIESHTVEPTHMSPVPADSTDPLTFVFGAEAAELFRGKAVRVTPDKRVSVYDVIKVVTDAASADTARKTFERLCEQHAEVRTFCPEFQFSGPGRPTPVTDVQGMLTLINLLPGANAARFRAGGARLLVRFLGGDESLVQEVQAIAQHHAEGRSTGGVGQLFHEAALTQQSTPAITTTANENKFMLLSPRQAGINLTQFAKKPVCYLITLIHEQQLYIKVGHSCDFIERLATHKREIPDLIGVWYVTEAPAAVETAFKDYMRCAGKLTSAKVGSKVQTELLKDIDPTEAEMELCKHVMAHQVQSATEIHRIEIQAEIEKERIHADIEKERLQAEIEKERMQLERLKIVAQLIEKQPDIATQLLQLLNRVNRF